MSPLLLRGWSGFARTPVSASSPLGTSSARIGMQCALARIIHCAYGLRSARQADAENAIDDQSPPPSSQPLRSCRPAGRDPVAIGGSSVRVPARGIAAEGDGDIEKP